MIITLPVFTFVGLGIQQAMDEHHIFICGLLFSTIFFRIFS